VTTIPVPPIPTPKAVDGAGLLGELRQAVARYVVFPSPQAADAVTLWTAATHAQPAWEHAPRLAVVSPLKRCGKSRLLDVVAETCHAPLITINATIAAVVRFIGADPPTLLVDEADTLWGTRKQADANEDLRGLLNAGHQRNRPMLRWDVTSRTAEQLDTFAMALLAAIGELPDTIMDRAVIIRMRRRAPGEQVQPYRTRRDAPPLNRLRDQLATWVRTHLRELHHATPAMPLEDRAADTWEPLIAIADLAGGDWPARARTAAATMTAAEAQHEEDTSASVRLLADLRQLFQAADAEALYTSTLLEALHKLEDAPWADWYGHPLATRDLAKLLRPYQVESKNVREHHGAPRKGYARADLHDAWARYVPLHPLQPLQAPEPAGQPGNRAVADQQPLSATSATAPRPVADVAEAPNPSATGLTSDVAHVADVAAPPGANGNGWRYDQPLTPCVACGAGTSNRTPSGRPLHLACANGAMAAGFDLDPDQLTPRHDTPPPEDPGR
jgi:hypothetical protein